MSPELGRFLQSDPVGFKGDASNLYRYCGNDPVDKMDPMGLLSGFKEYMLVYDRNEKPDATHDGYHIEGVKGTEDKPGDTVHLEVDRYVSRDLSNGDPGATTHQTTAKDVNGTPTINEQINVRYAPDAGQGPKTKAFTGNNEWTHSSDYVKAANNYRASAAALAAANKMSPSHALSMLQGGARHQGSRVLDSVSEFNRRSFRQSLERWDMTLSKTMYHTGGWKAPNGTYVWPHTPIDPESGNPINFNQ
jgi:uncharacterized protein RhaS with RHS repeats